MKIVRPGRTTKHFAHTTSILVSMCVRLYTTYNVTHSEPERSHSEWDATQHNNIQAHIHVYDDGSHMFAVACRPKDATELT